MEDCFPKDLNDLKDFNVLKVPNEIKKQAEDFRSLLFAIPKPPVFR